MSNKRARTSVSGSSSTPSKAPESTSEPKDGAFKAVNTRSLKLQGRDIPLTWDLHIKESVIDLVVTAGPFVDWTIAINNIENNDPDMPELLVDKVHIQSVDMFGPNKVGFIKFEVVARKWNEKEKKIALIPGVVFMRGGAVGILCVLIEAETGKEYSLITIQPRLPAGIEDFPEIPAGMLDGELNKKKFAGKAAKEMNEETLLEITESELFDLTHMAYGNKYKGMYPSAGGCDEFLKLYLCRRVMSKAALDMLRTAKTGDDPSEIIKLKIVPLEDLWMEAPDSKALSALYLYHKFAELKINHPPTPVNHQQEQALAIKLQPKLSEKEAGKGKEKATEAQGSQQSGGTKEGGAVEAMDVETEYEKALHAKEKELAKKEEMLKTKERTLKEKEQEFREKREKSLQQKTEELEQKEKELSEKEAELIAWEMELEDEARGDEKEAPTKEDKPKEKPKSTTKKPQDTGTKKKEDKKEIAAKEDKKTKQAHLKTSTVVIEVSPIDSDEENKMGKRSPIQVKRRSLASIGKDNARRPLVQSLSNTYLNRFFRFVQHFVDTASSKPVTRAAKLLEKSKPVTRAAKTPKKTGKRN